MLPQKCLRMNSVVMFPLRSQDFFCVLLGSVFPARGYFKVLRVSKSEFGWWPLTIGLSSPHRSGCLSPAWAPPCCPKPGHCLRCQNVNLIRVEFRSSHDSQQCVLLTLNGSTMSGTLPSHTKAYAHIREGHQVCWVFVKKKKSWGFTCFACHFRVWLPSLRISYIWWNYFPSWNH